MNQWNGSDGKGTAGDTFTWKLHVPQGGNYSVYVWYPAVPGAATNVRVQVFRGDDGSGLGSQVFEGELSVTSGRMAVGSVLAGQVLEVEVGATGYIPIRIFVDPVELPERVAVILGVATGCDNNP